MSLDRLSGESVCQHHRRLIYGKLVDKTLADVDYSELAEAVYGQPYSSDVARRMMYGSCKTLQILDEEHESVLPSDMLAELEEKRLEVQKEFQRYFDQRREYKKLVSADARCEHLYDALARAADGLSETVGCFYGDILYPVDAITDNEAVLVFSDWHMGLKTENMFNKFDVQICEERVRNVVSRAIERIQLHGCRKLHIAVLGDLYHGAIHTSARVASEEHVCDQLMRAAEILAQSIEYMGQYVPETVVYMTYGNHARTIQNKGDSIHRDNMERIIPWWLEQRLSMYENITIAADEGNEFIFIDVCGHGVCATHGDNDSVRSAPRLLATLFQKRGGRDVEYILLGDKHHRASFDELGVTALLCGSLCGTDDYANSKRLYSEPSQLLLIVNPSDGVDAEYRIKCG